MYIMCDGKNGKGREKMEEKRKTETPCHLRVYFSQFKPLTDGGSKRIEKIKNVFTPAVA